MMVSVHATVGAMVGAALKKPGLAFAGGVVSHLLCDLVPHRDYEMKIEAPLALTMYAYLARRYGVRSPQFCGAVGATIPDVENGLALLGVIREEQTLFPSHNKTAPWYLGHGEPRENPLPQIVLAAIALWLADRGHDED